jgi:glycosyltransferase involved in cell wall biosynthesis
MKVVLLAGASCIHTVRWANGLNSIGLEVFVISQHPLLEQMDDGVNVHILKYRGILGYFSMVPTVKKLLADIKPDIVNAHYASGYATTARLVNSRPWVLSVWGSDVYTFPYKSPIHRWLVKGNLYAADVVASTSHCMASQTKSLAPKLKEIFITPFGVDSGDFLDKNVDLNDEKKQAIVIGTVKTMAHIYGIDLLIKSFAIVYRKLTIENNDVAKKLQLRIVGDGPQLSQLQQLANDEGISHITTFIGRVAHDAVPSELSKLDIYVALSRVESFGVAIIEAGAMGKPVIVSNVGGLPEVVMDNLTGFVVPEENLEVAAIKIEQLVLNEKLRMKMGAEGKLHVTHTYDWKVCLNTMKNVYIRTIKYNKKSNMKNTSN